MKDILCVPDFRSKYLSHADVNKYLDALQAKYPHLVEVKVIGKSFEQRVLKSLRISMSATNNRRKSTSPLLHTNSKAVKRFSAVIPAKADSKVTPKPVIFIDGGMHAREWCTIPAALHCASQLTDNYEANKALLHAFDFVIVPIVNADGYEYSRTNVRIALLNHKYSRISQFYLFISAKDVAKIAQTHSMFQICWRWL